MDSSPSSGATMASAPDWFNASLQRMSTQPLDPFRGGHSSNDSERFGASHLHSSSSLHTDFMYPPSDNAFKQLVNAEKRNDALQLEINSLRQVIVTLKDEKSKLDMEFKGFRYV